MIVSDTALFVLMLGLALDAAIGDPDWLWRRFPHPVVLIGRLISWVEARANRSAWPDTVRRINGCGLVIVLTGLAAAVGLSVHWLAAQSIAGGVIEVVLVAILLAQRSLYEHVARVRDAFIVGPDAGLIGARKAVAMIVGRDPDTLDEAGVCRAAIETTAENFSDGIAAPAFWFAVLGLPGLLIYKAVNTADSMIGHRSQRYRAFGWAAARFDDGLNLAPARLSAVLVACVAPVFGRSMIDVLRTVCRDAGKHRSPNAGWPETAFAATLGLALAGPRVYAGTTVADPWLNAGGRQAATPRDIERALALLVAVCVALCGSVVLAVLASGIVGY